MSYSPVISGGVIVEVPKSEYEELIRSAEKIAAIERLFAVSDYVSKSDIMALLDIKKPTESDTDVSSDR